MFAAKLSNIYHHTSTWKIFLILFFIGLIARFIFPTFKLLHHDEAIHAWFVYQLLTTGQYSYDPMYHGPLLYYLMGAAFTIFETSDLIARIIPAGFGLAIIPLLYWLYNLGWLKRSHAMWAALFFAVSPNMVYFSRFLRHDIFQLFFTVLLLVSIIAYIEKREGRFALLAGFAAACGMCLKEEMPFTIFIFGSFFVVMILLKQIELPSTWIRDLIGAVIIAAGVGFLLFSSFLATPEMFLNAPFKAIEHWGSMHGQCRLCGPPYWYLIMLSLYELPLLALAIWTMAQWGIKERGIKQVFNLCRTRVLEIRKRSGTIRSLPQDKRDLLIILTVWWAVLSIMFYGYFGEKVPWLLIHQLFPLILLAAYKIENWKRIAAIITCVYLVIMTIHICFTPGDINEPIIQVQNSEDMKEVMKLIDASDRVVVASESYWPLPWYYRGDKWDKITFYGKKVDPETYKDLDPDMIITHDSESYSSLSGYEKRLYRLSYWFSWYDNEKRAIEWFFKRDGKSGSVNLDIFIKPDTASKYPVKNKDKRL